jgi:hypothetical protein
MLASSTDSLRAERLFRSSFWGSLPDGLVAATLPGGLAAGEPSAVRAGRLLSVDVAIGADSVLPLRSRRGALVMRGRTRERRASEKGTG